MPGAEGSAEGTSRALRHRTAAVGVVRTAGRREHMFARIGVSSLDVESVMGVRPFLRVAPGMVAVAAGGGRVPGMRPVGAGTPMMGAPGTRTPPRHLRPMRSSSGRSLPGTGSGPRRGGGNLNMGPPSMPWNDRPAVRGQVRPRAPSAVRRRAGKARRGANPPRTLAATALVPPRDWPAPTPGHARGVPSPHTSAPLSRQESRAPAMRPPRGHTARIPIRPQTPRP